MNIISIPQGNRQIYKCVVDRDELEETLELLDKKRYQVLNWDTKEEMIHILYKRKVIWKIYRTI